MSENAPSSEPKEPRSNTSGDDSKDESPSRSSRLVQQLLWFRATIDGMRELTEAIQPHVAELDSFEPRVRSLVDCTPLPDEKKKRLKEALIESAAKARAGKAALSLSVPSERPDEAPAATRSSTREGGESPEAWAAEQAEAQKAGDSPDTPPATEDESVAVDVYTHEVAFRLLSGFADATVAPRGPMLFGALLVLAVATFESLLGSIYGQHLALHPNALDAQEKEFSLAELQDFGDVSAAQEALIGRKVDAFTQQSLADWSRWSARTLKVPLEDLATDPRKLRELFQRRHIIVHSAGRVSRQYLNRVDFGSDATPTIGKRLPVDRGYLDGALDVLDVVGTLVALVAWQKWIPEESDAPARKLGDVGYDLLTSDSWSATRLLCSKGRELLDLPHGTELQSRVNEWLARKRQDGIDSIAGEVESWDISALAPRFRLARSALVDDLDTVFEELPKLIEQEEVTLADVATWPLLAEARQDPRAEPLLERFAA